MGQKAHFSFICYCLDRHYSKKKNRLIQKCFLPHPALLQGYYRAHRIKEIPWQWARGKCSYIWGWSLIMRAKGGGGLQNAGRGGGANAILSLRKGGGGRQNVSNMEMHVEGGGGTTNFGVVFMWKLEVLAIGWGGVWKTFLPLKKGGGVQKRLPRLQGLAQNVSDPQFSHSAVSLNICVEVYTTDSSSVSLSLQYKASFLDKPFQNFTLWYELDIRWNIEKIFTTIMFYCIKLFN